MSCSGEGKVNAELQFLHLARQHTILFVNLKVTAGPDKLASVDAACPLYMYDV